MKYYVNHVVHHEECFNEVVFEVRDVDDNICFVSHSFEEAFGWAVMNSQSGRTVTREF